MFEELRIQNFRSVRDSGTLRLAPLTVLIGANNSGKSSILAALLLLKQSIQDVNPATGLVTSGPLVDVGSYFDILPTGRPAEPLQISFRLERDVVRRYLNVADYGPPALSAAPKFDHFEFAFGYDSARNTVDVVRAGLIETGTGNKLELVRDRRAWKIVGLKDGVSDYVRVFGVSP